MRPASDACDPGAGAVDEEIRARLRAQRMRGDFAAIHAGPASPQEIPDLAGARLAVLGPESPHREGSSSGSGSVALEQARALLGDAGGGARRVYRNMLVFLAPDADRLEELRASVRGWLAWRAVSEDEGRPRTVEVEQAQKEAGERGEAVGALLSETWQWLLAPSAAAGWTTSRIEGREELAMRASRRLRAEGSLFVEYPAVRLRADLDRVPLWPAGEHHVRLAEVWEAYASSVELPRLRSSAVLAAAVQSGIAAPDWASETFAYAESWDPGRGRFDGLLAGYHGSLALKGSGLLVRAEVAQAQLAAESGEA